MTSRALRRELLAALLCSLVAAALVACRGGGNGDHSATGVIIDVQARSLTELDSFTVRENSGKTVAFRVAPDAVQDPQEGFFPGHLRSHAVLAEPVTVFYHKDGDLLLAFRLEHADLAAASPAAVTTPTPG